MTSRSGGGERPPTAIAPPALPDRRQATSSGFEAWRTRFQLIAGLWILVPIDYVTARTLEEGGELDCPAPAEPWISP